MSLAGWTIINKVLKINFITVVSYNAIYSVIPIAICVLLGDRSIAKRIDEIVYATTHECWIFFTCCSSILLTVKIALGIIFISLFKYSYKKNQNNVREHSGIKYSNTYCPLDVSNKKVTKKLRSKCVIVRITAFSFSGKYVAHWND